MKYCLNASHGGHLSQLKLVSNLLEPNKFKVYKTNRGGQYTYHGPGQRIVYVMLDLRKNGYDIKGFITLLAPDLKSLDLF